MQWETSDSYAVQTNGTKKRQTSQEVINRFARWHLPGRASGGHLAQVPAAILPLNCFLHLLQNPQLPLIVDLVQPHVARWTIRRLLRRCVTITPIGVRLTLALDRSMHCCELKLSHDHFTCFYDSGFDLLVYFSLCLEGESPNYSSNLKLTYSLISTMLPVLPYCTSHSQVPASHAYPRTRL